MAKIVVHVFFTTTNGDKDYQKFRLMFSAGKQDAGPGYVGTIAAPVPVKNVEIVPDLPDPVFFSVPFSVAEKGFVRGILARIRSVGGVVPSSCTLEFLSLPEPASDEWKHLSEGEITLIYCPDPVHPDTFKKLLTDPQAFASVGDIIFGIDHDTRLLTILGISELVGKHGPYIPEAQPYDMSVYLNDVDDDDDETIRGRAIIALESKLFPLFLDYVWNERTEKAIHAPGILTRVGVAGRELAYEKKAIMGKNPQEVCPGVDRNGEEPENEDGEENADVKLFVPCIGGDWLSDDGDTIATNGEESVICVLDANGDWTTEYNGIAPVLITGDSNQVSEATAFDIHDLGVIMRNRASLFFILTVMYGGASFSRLYYRLYLSTVGEMLDLLNQTNPPPPDPPEPPEPSASTVSDDPPLPRPTLSGAVALGALKVIDEGEIASNANEPAGLYHPSLNIVQHPTDKEKDLVVLCTGSMTLVTRALAYGSPTAKNAPEPEDGTESGEEAGAEPPYSRSNPYLLFANNGGVSMNSLDISIETLYQALRGNVSLKHGVRMSQSSFAGAARMGTAAPVAPIAPAATEEEEGDAR
jgi:hypothetical protein